MMAIGGDKAIVPMEGRAQLNNYLVRRKAVWAVSSPMPLYYRLTQPLLFRQRSISSQTLVPFLL
jgi:hypothetical protein